MCKMLSAICTGECRWERATGNERQTAGGSCRNGDRRSGLSHRQLAISGHGHRTGRRPRVRERT
jgi:hypothetical protein